MPVSSPLGSGRSLDARQVEPAVGGSGGKSSLHRGTGWMRRPEVAKLPVILDTVEKLVDAVAITDDPVAPFADRGIPLVEGRDHAIRVPRPGEPRAQRPAMPAPGRGDAGIVDNRGARIDQADRVVDHAPHRVGRIEDDEGYMQRLLPQRRLAEEVSVAQVKAVVRYHDHHGIGRMARSRQRVRYPCRRRRPCGDRSKARGAAPGSGASSDGEACRRRSRRPLPP